MPVAEFDINNPSPSGPFTVKFDPMTFVNVPANGVTLPITSAMTIIKMDEIAEQIREAKELSTKVLSKEELEKIKAKADEVLDGAMVFTSSEVLVNY